MTASFRELDILIFRSVVKDFTKTPLNVSKITLSNLELISHMGSSMDTSGSIGNVTVCDLASTTDSIRRNIFAVGDAISTSGSGVKLNDSSGGDPSEPEKALTFTFDKKPDSRNLTVSMASAYYVHNSKFVSEMAMCAGDYKHYAVRMAKSIQVAASDMAKSMVAGKRNLPVSPQKTGSEYGGESMVVDGAEASTVELESPAKESQMAYTINIKSPVMVFPVDNERLDFLVGHLGKIRVSNACNPATAGRSYSSANTERIRLEIEKINVSMLNISDDDDEEGIGRNATTFTNIHQLLSSYSSRMVSLLNNTDLLVHIERIAPQYEQDAQAINVYAQINTEIKLFLSVPVYQQILATLKYSTSNPNSTVGGVHSVPATPISSSAASSNTSLSLSISNER